MSETKPMHRRNVLEIRWCPTKEPVKPLGCRVTLPKTRMEPEDKPEDREESDQDHLEGQAPRQMLGTSSSSSKSICYRSHSIDLLQIPVNRSATDPNNRSVTDPTSTPKTCFMFRIATRINSKMVTKINSSSNIVRCTVYFPRCVAILVTSTGLVCSTVLMPSSSSPAMLRWLSVTTYGRMWSRVSVVYECLL